MVTKLTESESKLYCRYIVTTSPYKDDFTKIDVVDNYFDKSDYAFVNLSTGEIKSYSDVALNYVLNVLKSANMAMYDVKPRARYKFYTEPHSSKVVDVKLVESKLIKESDQPPKAETLLVSATDLKKLGHDVDDFVSSDGKHLVTIAVCYHIGKCGDVYSTLVGYETSDDIFGYYDTATGFTRHNISKGQMKAQLLINAETLWEDSVTNQGTIKTEAESSTTLIGRAMAQAGYTDQSLSQSKDLISQDLTDAQITVNAVFNYLKALQLSKATHDEDKYAMLEDALRTGLSKIKQIRALVQENIQDVEALLEMTSAAVKNK